MRPRARSGQRRRGSAVAIGCGVFLASISASGHTNGVPIPPESDYLVRWYQPHGAQPVQNWEIEVTPQSNPGAMFIASAQVAPDASCWALNVPTSGPANVRIRSVSGTEVSPWSRYTTVPEPGLAVGLVAATGLLSVLARKRRRGRRGAATPPGC